MTSTLLAPKVSRQLLSTHQPLPVALRLFWAGSVLGLLLTLLTAALKAQRGLPRVAWNPLADPLFGDLTEYIPTFRLLHTAAFYHPAASPVAYPPFAAGLFAAVYATGHPICLYLSLAAMFLMTALVLIARAFHRQGMRWRLAIAFPLTLAFTCFPIAGLLQRGNLELMIWILAAAGIWAWVSEQDDAAGVLWGLAAAIKLYPIIYLVLLLSGRRYRAFALGVSAFVVSSMLSMLFLGPSLAEAWRGSLKNVFGYQGVRVAEFSMHELAANHSCFGLLKLIALSANVSASHLTLPYYACGAAFFATLYFSRMRSLPRVNQLLIVSLFMVMLPPVSYFYTLVHLCGPGVLLLQLAYRTGLQQRRVPGLTATLLLLIPIFTAYTAFTYRSMLIFGGLLQAVLLCVLLIQALRYPFETSDC